MRYVSVLLFALAASVAGGCASNDEDVIDDEDALRTTDPLSVAGKVLRSCSTGSVAGLAEQLVEEMQCMKPGVLVKIDVPANVTLEPEVFPYLQAPAAKALHDAAVAYGSPMQLNSALRTLPQQYLLRRWDVNNRCGVKVAASVGQSNHEAGLAVDVDLKSARENRATRVAMTAQGFEWLGDRDPVHYQMPDSGEDIVGTSTLAFKRLWNRNHPESQLELTTRYDAITEAKLKIAPAAGFAVGARCDTPQGESQTTTPNP